MKGGPKTDAWGFTIVETLIVLAVTGVIMTSALVLVSGRQDKTRWQVAINQTQLSVQKVINEVSNGYFPENNGFSCLSNATGKVIINASAGGQGQNKGCIFLGKVVQYGQATDYGKQVVFPVAGRRLVEGTSSEVTTLVQAQPTAVKLGNAVDLSDTTTFEGGLNVRDMWINNDRSRKTNALAFYTNLASYEVDGSSLKTGQLVVDMYAVNNLAPGVSKYADAISQVNDNNVQKINRADICFSSGTTNQSGQITIGSTSGGELAVTLAIKSGASC